MAVKKDKRIIQALQGLRAIAFIGVFLNHSIGGMACLGAAGVSVFFVLSGFLLAVSYWDRDPAAGKSAIMRSARFSWIKIRKLYLLHIFMMILVIIYEGIIIGYQAKMILPLSGKIILNVLLMQAWIPKSEFYFSLNAVSWYLSTAMFCYFAFPLLFSILKKECSFKRLFKSAGVFFVLMCAAAVLAAFIGSSQDKEWFSQHWMTYVFPFSRFLDFSLGVTAGCLYMLTEKAHYDVTDKRNGNNPSGSRLIWTVFELLVILLFAAAIMGFRYTPNWLKYSALYIVPSLGIVYILALQKGLVSRFLSLAPFQYIGKISGHAFLIHWLAIRVTSLIIHHFFPEAANYLIVLSAFALTTLASEISIRLFAWIERLINSRGSKRIFLFENKGGVT